MPHVPLVSSLFGAFDPSNPQPSGAALETILGIEPILIDAPLEAVWGIIVDFERYPEWNPLNRSFRLDSEAKVGAGVTFGYTLKAPGPGGRLPEPDREQHEIITVWETQSCFSYADFGFGYKNERTQYIWSDGPERTYYITYERFSGILSPLIRWLFGARIVEAFRRNGDALKARAEAIVPPPDSGI